MNPLLPDGGEEDGVAAARGCLWAFAGLAVLALLALTIYAIVRL